MKTKMKLQIVVLVLVFSIINTGFSQIPGKPPYPIIFVHGWVGQETAWTHPNGNWVNEFQSKFNWNYGGIIHICLDNTNGSLVNSIQEDVEFKQWSPPIGYENGNGDFFLVNFNIKKNNFPHPQLYFEWNYVNGTSNTIEFDESITDQIVEGDILVASGSEYLVNYVYEYMVVQSVNYITRTATVTRGEFGTTQRNWNAFIGWVNDIKNHSNLSNQASIVKGAKGVKIAIDKVKNETGAQKVILIAHSMGGLNCRQYISSLGYQNDVAKLVTISTPHLGSNSSDMNYTYISEVMHLDLQSDAVRDLRATITDDWTSYAPQSPYGDHPDNAVFLFGGLENTVWNDFDWYSLDMDGDGIVGGINITPLNMNSNNWPSDVLLHCIVARRTNVPTDEVVRADRQYPWPYLLPQNMTVLENIPINMDTSMLISDNFEVLHMEAQAYLEDDMRGLDEPKNYQLAYEIKPNSGYVNGFITYQRNGTTTDFDWFKFKADVTGQATFEVLNMPNPNYWVIEIKNQGQTTLASLNQNSSQSTLTFDIIQNQYYYLFFDSQATSSSWENPYTFRITTIGPNPVLSLANISNIPNPVSYSGGSYSISVNNSGTGTLTWNTQSVQSWVHLNPSTTSTNVSTTVSVIIDPNTGAYRSCNIKFYNTANPSNYQYLNIYQEGQPTASSNWESFYKDPQNTGYQNVTLNTNMGIQWQATSPISLGSSYGPIVVDDRMVIASSSGLVCYDLNGNHLWTNSTIPCNTFPAIYNNVLFVADDQDDGLGKLFAVNLNNGSIIGQTAGSSFYDGTIKADETGIYVLCNNVYMFAYTFNGSSFTLKWAFSSSSSTIGKILNYLSTGPAIFGDYIYVNGVDANSNNSDLYLIRINKSSGTYSVHVKINSPSGGITYLNSPVVYNSNVYFTFKVGTAGVIECYNSGLTSSLWAYSAFNDYRITPPVCYNSKVYVGDDDGYVYCFNATNGSLIFSNDNGTSIEEGMAISNSCLIAQRTNEIDLINLTNGVEIKGISMSSSHYGPPAVKGNRIFTSGTNEVIYCLSDAFPPTANFTASQTSGYAPLNVTFDNTSTQGSSSITGYFWDFGDGTTSTSFEPSHTYSTVGVYTVNLTAYSSSGSNTKTRTNYITVQNPPNILFIPTTHVFGDIYVNSCSDTYTFILKNNGGGTATGNISLSNQTDFTITPGITFSLGSGQTQDVIVKFCPASSGNKTGILTADAASPSNDATATVSGDGIIPFITLSSPNGNETWLAGGSYPITWSDNIAENVKIELFKGGILNQTIDPNTPSDGYFNWPIPPSQVAGTDYKIKITSLGNSSVYDESINNFIITNEFTISGVVKNQSNQGIPGVTITFSNNGGNVTTNASGAYIKTVPGGYSGTATPSHACYFFTPPNMVYPSVTSNQTNQDYVGTSTGLPSDPGPITGSQSPCKGSTGNVYSVANAPGISYAWSYSGTGANITAGQGTYTITVSYEAAATAGNWSVIPSNNCGNGPSSSLPIAPISCQTYTLTIASQNPSSGVEIGVSPTDNNGNGNGTTQFTRNYNASIQVTLTAPSVTGSNVFVKWQKNGSDFAITQQINIAVDASDTYTAVFGSGNTNTITVTSNTNNADIIVNPPDNYGMGNGTAPFTRTYNSGTSITLTAPASIGTTIPNSVFRQWRKNGEAFSDNTAITIPINQNDTYSAIYVSSGYPSYDMTIASENPNSGVSITVTPPDVGQQGNGITQFTRIFYWQEQVTLTAPLNAGGNNFVKWQKNENDYATTQQISFPVTSSDTYTAVYSSSTTLPYQESFETYPLDAYLAQSNPTWWKTWDNHPGTDEDARIKNTYSHSSTKSALVQMTAVDTTDVLLKLGNRTTGYYELKWWMYVESDKAGYYNIQHYEVPPIQWACEVYLTQSGAGQLYAGSSTPVTFSFPKATWFEVKHLIDLDNDNIILYINGNLIHQWPFSYQATSTTGVKQLGSVDFFAGVQSGSSETPKFYLDDIYFNYATPPLTISGTVRDQSSIGIPNVTVSFSNGGGTATTNSSGYYTVIVPNGYTGTATPVLACYSFSPLSRSYSGITSSQVNQDYTGTQTLPSNPGAMTGPQSPCRESAGNVYSVANAPGISYAWSYSGTGASITAGQGTYNITVSYNATATAGNWSVVPSNACGNGPPSVLPVTPVTCQTYTLTIASQNPPSGVQIGVSPTDNNGNGSGTTQFSRDYNASIQVTLTAPSVAGSNVFLKWLKNATDYATTQQISFPVTSSDTYTAVYGSSTALPYQEPFETYPLDAYLAQSNPTWWKTWDNHPGTDEDARIKNTYSHSSTKSALVQMTAVDTTDVLLKLGNRTTGYYELKWWMYVESDKAGYYNIQHYEVPPIQWACEVYLTQSGAGQLYAGSSTPVTFSYPKATWFEIKHLIDLDNDNIILYINGNLIHQWPFSYQATSTTGVKQLGSVDFFAGVQSGSSETPKFYLDDVYFNYATPPLTISGTVRDQSNIGIPNVTVSFSNGGGTATTNSSGYYTVTVPNGYTGTATPVLACYSFSPLSRSYSGITSSQVNQDYTGTQTGLPSGPGQITGPTSPCLGSSGNVYSVNNTSGVTYTWNYSGTGQTITSGQGTSSIVVSYASSSTGGTWTVVPSNTCGNGPSSPPLTVTLVSCTTTIVFSSQNPNSGVPINVSPTDLYGNGNGTTQFTRVYNPNQPITVSAPSTIGNNVFQYWLLNGSFYTNGSSIVFTTALPNVELTAVYACQLYTLTVASQNPSSGVNISVSPPDYYGNSSGATQFTRSFCSGTAVTLTAPASANGNVFQKWVKNGTDFSTNSSITFNLLANDVFTAVYVCVGYALNVGSANPSSGVTMNVTPIDNSGLGNGITPFARVYCQGIQITITAVSPSGYTFSNWTATGITLTTQQISNPLLTITMPANAVSLTANFISSSLPYQESFESFSLNSYLAQSYPLWWATRNNLPGTNEDALIKDTYSHSSSRSALAVMTGNQATEVILKLGNRTTGNYELKWWMYVETSNAGYYSIQHYETPGIEWACEVLFEQTGTGKLYAGSATPITFTYPKATWYEVKHLIDLTNNNIKLYINGSLVYQWPFNYQSVLTTGINQLGCVDFWAGTFSPASTKFYFDDLYFNYYTSVPTQLNTNSATIGSGQSLCYNATQTITVAGSGTAFTVQNGGSATFIAGQNILFEPTTMINTGGYAHGYISTTGNYCNPVQSVMVAATTTGEGEHDGVIVPSSWGFRLYPNPTPGKFTLEFTGMAAEPAAMIRVFNMMGAEVMKKAVTAGKKTELSLENQAPGIYMVSVLRDGKLETTKIVRQE